MALHWARKETALQDLVAVARVLVALAFYVTAYVLPAALLLGASIRVALRWHSSWRLIAAAALAAAPQAVMVATKTPRNTAFFVGAGLTAIAAVLYVVATRGHRGGAKRALDVAAVAVVLVAAVAKIRWIVG